MAGKDRLGRAGQDAEGPKRHDGEGQVSECPGEAGREWFGLLGPGWAGQVLASLGRNGLAGPDKARLDVRRRGSAGALSKAEARQGKQRPTRRGMRRRV